MANMIQNYANNLNQGITSMNNTTKKYYNNIADANSDSLLKPLDGKGYLVDDSLINAPKEFAKDTYYTAKSLHKGITGKANDHELGKLNDLGLKLGGVMIATYLMTKRQTPKTKMMEFVGFGAFLASMAIWPKVALQWPAKLIHGVDFRKQYVDEQGRKKYATQDPNYIPFDLYKGKKKSEDLGHIADKAGISKSEKDRNELAKEHIRKVSVQNNTLWMLTAGGATPIMTALASSALEKPIGKLAEKYSNNKVNKLADNIETYLATKSDDLEKQLIKPDKNAADKLETVLKNKTGVALQETDITEIAEAMTDGLDTKTQKAARKDLVSMLSEKKTLVNNETGDNIAKVLTERLDAKYGEGYTASIFDTKKLGEHVHNFMNPKESAALNPILEQNKAEELRLSLTKIVEESISGNESIRNARKEIINSMAYETIDEVLGKNKVSVLTEDTAKGISKAGAIVRNFKAFDKTISEVTHFKVENAQETIAGNNWGEVTETLIKELKITPKELNEAKSSEELTAQLFTRKLEAIVKDEKRYKDFVSNIADKMAELDIKLDNPQEGKKPVMDILMDGIKQNCDNTANELKNVNSNAHMPFSNLAERISAREINGSATGSIKEAKLRRIQQARVGGIQNAYMRLLHTADFFKRSEEYLSKNGENKAGFSGDMRLDKGIIEKGKKLLMSSHSGDFFMKHETGNNVDFYKSIMWHVFGAGEQGMSQSTKEALNKETHQVFTGGQKTSMAQRVSNWSKHIYTLMGKTKYDFLPDHIVDGADDLKEAKKTAVEKFNQIACTPDNMLYKALKQKYNYTRWMKPVATVGGILLAGTVAAQFAFGKQDNNVKTTK